MKKKNEKKKAKKWRTKSSMRNINQLRTKEDEYNNLIELKKLAQVWGGGG